MKIGYCISGKSFVPQMGDTNKINTLDLLKKEINLMDINGYNFAELTVGSLLDLDEDEFKKFRRFAQTKRILVNCANSFLPMDNPPVGKNVDKEKLYNHVDKAMQRMKELNGHIIVFGSGAARRCPDDFDFSVAWAQLKEFLIMCNTLGEKYDVNIAIEPLNTAETNMINTVSDALRLAKEVNLPRIGVLGDTYHMDIMKEDFSILKEAGELLYHVHLSGRDRSLPGENIDSNIDFKTVIDILKEMNYKGLASLECKTENLGKQSLDSLIYLNSIKGEKMELKVMAGNHVRKACPAKVCLTKAQAAEIKDSNIYLSCNNKKTDAQVVYDGDETYIVFIVDGMEAYTEKIYTVESDNSGCDNVKLTHKENEEKIDISIKNEYFTEFVYKKEIAKPYLGKIIDPDVGSYTRNDPTTKEHPHHRSVWFAIGDIDGIDFWNEPEGEYGWQIHQKFNEISSGSVFGQISTSNTWTDFNKNESLIDDDRTIRIYNTSSDCRIIEVELTLKANYKDVNIGATKEAGPLGIRMAESMKVDNGGRMINSVGSFSEKECWGKRADWCDYTGEADGNTLGITVFDNIENKDYPTYWHIRDYGLMAPNNFFFLGDVPLKKGETLNFKYRICFHKNAGNAEMCSAAYQNYLNPPVVSVVE